MGLGAGTVLYCLGIPSMMLGLGVYLPFYMTISATLGACIKWAYDRIAAHRDNAANARSATCAPANTAASTGNLRSATGDNTSADNAPEITHEESGIVIASGVLGGESIVGVIIALMSVAGGLMG
mgnify:FL=1